MVFCLFMQMNMVETQAATKVGNTKITSITQTGKKSVKVAFKKVSGAKDIHYSTGLPVVHGKQRM